MKKSNKIKNYSLKAAKIGKKKNVKGFTLVELIVVIAIIGVLAVVLVPNMMGRVKDARLTTANDAAAKIAEQTRIAIADLDAAGKSYTTYFGGATADATKTNLSASSSNELEKAVAAACPETQNANYVAVSVSADGSKVAVIYQEKANSPYIGLYPKPDDYKYNKNMTTTTYTIAAGELTKASSGS